MRIAYVFDAVTEDGVTRKMREQLTEWDRTAEARAFFLVPESEHLFPVPGERFDFSSLVSRIRASTKLVRSVAAYEPDVVYLRYDLFFPAVWRLAARRTCVIEVNTNDISEVSVRPLLTRVYNRLNHRVLFHAANAFVAVTAELARNETQRGFRGPVCVIGNGGRGPGALAGSRPDGGPPRIVFLGSDRPWHGLDRLLEIARRLPRVQFDLIGIDATTPELPNVRCHGHIAPDLYGPILATADAAIGPLGLDRKKMRECSTLKVPEYLLHGTPVILAHVDTDLSGRGLEYVLELPEKRDVDGDALAIEAFLERVKDFRVPRAEAEALVGIERKEAERLEFLRSVVDRIGARRASTPASQRRNDG